MENQSRIKNWKSKITVRKESNLKYELLSRTGDDRLKNSKEEQKKFFSNIQNSYMSYWANNPDKNICDENIDLNAKKYAEISRILFHLRILREAILSSEESTFTKNVLLYSMRIGVSWGHIETYLPSVLELINKINLKIPLTKLELNEVIGIYSLHVSHLNHDINLAFQLIELYKIDDALLEKTICSFAELDYITWKLRLKNEKDIGRRRIMKFADNYITNEAIKRITVSYFDMQKKDLQDILQCDFENLLENLHCGWKLDLEGKRVIIRTRKAKK